MSCYGSIANRQRSHFVRMFLACLITLGMHLDLRAQEGEKEIPKSLYEVASVGAPMTSSLIEGCVGSISKGYHRRFYCQSTGSGAAIGFLGPQEVAKSISVKDQPGIFPAPLVNAASITFQFHCQAPHTSLTPIVVRPDGTIYQGLAMTAEHSPQTLFISSPAQTGIYTLFVLNHQQENCPDAHVMVDASVSTQPQEITTLLLKPFKPEEEGEFASAEFIYHSSHYLP